MLKQQHTLWIITLLAAAIAASLLGLPDRPAALAQDTTNLLTNGSMEQPYYGQSSSTATAPQGWRLWVGAGNPDAFPHTDSVNVRDGAVSWNMKQGYVAFAAAGYQQVSGLNPGDKLKATAYGWTYTCDNTEDSCIIQEAPYRKSDQSAGVQMKVGIDPTGGTDPNSGAVLWSPVAAPYDQWAEMSVTAAAESGTVTVFLYVTQSKGLFQNNAYWDAASLVRTDASAAVANATAEPTAPPEVPFVTAQGVRPDGSIVHIVQPNDTLWSIAFAYRDYGVTVQSIADINANIETNTRFLQLGQEVIILPPGSVDPVTGALAPAGSQPPVAANQPVAQVSGLIGAAATAAAAAPVIMPSATPNPTATSDVSAAPTENQAAAAIPASPENPPAAPTEAVAEVAQAAVVTEEAAEPVEPTAVASSPTPMPTVEEAAAAVVEPTATVAAQEAAAAGLTATTGALCVVVYQDANQNMTRDSGEDPLAGATVLLSEPGSAEMQYDYDGSGPLCVDLAPGRYQVRATPPEGYGLTSAGSATVSLVSGRQVNVLFGGAEGYVPAAEATSAGATGESIQSGAMAPMVEVVVDEKSEEDKDVLDRLYDNSGLLVLGFAGVVLFGGALLLLAVRRFSH